MSMDQYSLSTDRLIISDPELQIELSQEFHLPRLPLDLDCKSVTKDKDADGNLVSAYLVSDGRRHGECHLYGSPGKLRAGMFYLHGKLHGPSFTYSDQGKILSKTWYCEGKKIGKAHFYSVSGSLLSLQRFKNGEWEGLQEYFYEADKDSIPQVKSIIPFSGGKLHGQVRLFWESGKPKRYVHYVNGLREGVDSIWNEQGVLIDEGEYQAGKQVGVHRHYFANGKLKEELNYHTPQRYDRKEWDASGKALFEGIFAADLTYTERVFLVPHGSKVRKGVWDGNSIRFR